jgi:hypothetical protein
MDPVRPITSTLTALLLVAAVVAFTSCRRGEQPPGPSEPKLPPWFIDVTESKGLRFQHDPGPDGTYFMPQIVGSGGALLDYDNDGRLDLYLLQNAGPESSSRNQLFHQEADGSFKDVSAGSGLDVAGFGMGATVGDVNNDGLVDVLVTEYGRTRLFINRGDGKFEDVTMAAGIDNPLWGVSAAFLDYDRDGWLDLVIGNYVIYVKSTTCKGLDGRPDYCNPNVFFGSVSKLYRNLGASVRGSAPVRFEDTTVQSGLTARPGPALGVLCADFNGDRWPDIFIANDSRANHLWINQKNGTFKEEAVARGLATNRIGQMEANMGVALGDIDDDGLFDIFVTHLHTETHTLWKQGPRGQFQDRTVSTGLASPQWRSTGFGTTLTDFDHDGDLDAAVVNGNVVQPQSRLPADFKQSFWAIYADRNQLFVNEGRGRFSDLSTANPDFSGTPGISRSLMCGDLDNDGAVDLVVTAVNAPARIFRNVAPKQGHWLSVRAIDPALKRDAYGAEVTVEAGGRRFSRQSNPAYSYACSNDPRMHFGLALAERVERISVVWPDGVEEHFLGGSADRFVTVKKGEGKQP